MKINKLLAAVVVAAFALPVMAQTAPAAPSAPAPAPAAPMAAPAPAADAMPAPAKNTQKKHRRTKKHDIKAIPSYKGA